MKKYIRCSYHYSSHVQPEPRLDPVDSEWDLDCDICTIYLPLITIKTDADGKWDWYEPDVDDLFYGTNLTDNFKIDNPTMILDEDIIDEATQRLSVYLDDKVKKFKSTLIEISGEISVEVVYPSKTTYPQGISGDRVREVDWDNAEMDFFDFSYVNIKAIEE